MCWCLAWTCSGADSSSRRGRGNEREARPNRDRGNREDIHGGCASDTAAPGFRRDVAPGSGQPTAADFGRSHRSRADQQPDVLEPTKRSGSSGLGGTRGVCGLLAGSQRLGGVRPHRRRCAASRHGCGLHPEHGLVLFELLAERRLELERLDAVRDPQRPRRRRRDGRAHRRGRVHSGFAGDPPVHDHSTGPGRRRGCDEAARSRPA